MNKNNIMNIEELNDHIGQCVLDIKKYCKSVNLENYISLAFNILYGDLNKLENATVISENNTKNIISLIYLATENLINSLIKAILIKNGKDNEFDNIKKKNIVTRCADLIELIGEKKDDVYKATNVCGILQEFTTFRNEIFHDRFLDNKISFKHTNFSSEYTNIGVYDAIESLRVYIIINRTFSKCIDKYNLMQNVIMRKDHSYYFERVDYLYEHLLIPYYKSILSKHHLTTKYPFDIVNYYQWKNFINSEEIFPLIKATPDKELKKCKRTNLGEEFYAKIVKQKKIKPGTFGIPNFTDDTRN